MVSLLASAPLAAAFGAGDVVAFEKRHVVSSPFKRAHYLPIWLINTGFPRFVR